MHWGQGAREKIRGMRLEIMTFILALLIGGVVLCLSYAVGEGNKRNETDEDFWSLILYTPRTAGRGSDTTE